jgi:hypothetical protein
MEISLDITALITVGRLALAGVLISTGVAKLAHPESHIAAMRDFGVRLPVRPQWAACGLAVAEIALGLALGSGFGLLIAGPLTVVLLVVFTSAIIASLIRGRRFPCRCLGALSTRPIGLHTVTRNTILLMLAIATCVQAFSRVTTKTEPTTTDVLLSGHAAEWTLLASSAGLVVALIYLLDNIDFGIIGLLYGRSERGTRA